MGLARCVLQRYFPPVPRDFHAAAAAADDDDVGAFVTGVMEKSTWYVTAAEDEQAAAGRFYLAQIAETLYQNPIKFLYCGQ